MDYKKKYEEALERAKVINPGTADYEVAVKIFPELKSEDEMVVKAIIKLVKGTSKSYTINALGVDQKDMIDYLEKQGEMKSEQKLPLCWIKCSDSLPNRDGTYLVVTDGRHNDVYDMARYDSIEGWHKASKIIYWMPIPQLNNGSIVEQKPADKVEPKFKVGDWVIDKQGIVNQIASIIENVTCHTHGYDIVGGGYFNDNTEGVRLWTIQDAKEGDVLCCENGWTCIFKSLDSNSFSSYCFMDCSEWFCELGGECHSLNKNLCGKIHPATKEQRDILFQRMKEAGYKWDADRKELKKIKQKPTWSEEDETKFKFLYHLLDERLEEHGSFLIQKAKELGYVKKQVVLNMLESLKERMKENVH